METAGYEVQAFVLPACAVNAPHRRDRVWIVAHCPQRDDGRYIGRTENRQVQKSRNSAELVVTPDSDSERLQGWDEHRACAGERAAWQSHTERWKESWFDVALRTCLRRVDDGAPRRMDRAGELPGKSKKKTAAGRAHRLKALGNAIVPQVAYEIFRSIEALLRPDIYPREEPRRLPRPDIYPMEERDL